MIEQVLLDFLKHDGGHDVEWNTTPTLCEVIEPKGDEDIEYPVMMQLGRADEEEYSNCTNGTGQIVSREGPSTAKHFIQRAHPSITRLCGQSMWWEPTVLIAGYAGTSALKWKGKRQTRTLE